VNHLLAHFPNILANEQQDLAKKRKGEQKKNSSRCYARLCEKAHPLKAPGSVASFLRNSQIYRINDRNECDAPWRDSGRFVLSKHPSVLPQAKRAINRPSLRCQLKCPSVPCNARSKKPFFIRCY
jgi:hypothetical protein